jgi:hypothetical protein
MRKIAPKLAAIMITFFVGTSASLLLDTLNTDVVTSSNSKVENVRNAVLSPPIYSQNSTYPPISVGIVARVAVSANGTSISASPPSSSTMFKQASINPAHKARFLLPNLPGKNIKLQRSLPLGFKFYQAKNSDRK